MFAELGPKLQCFLKVKDDLSEVLVFQNVTLNCNNRVGRCVIPWEFLGKSVKHTFSCRKKGILSKKKDVSNFFLPF